MSAVLGFRARLSKLRAMSAAEVLERVRYGAVVGLERLEHRRGAVAPSACLHRALAKRFGGADWRAGLLASRRANQARWLPSVSERDAMRRLFETEFVAEREDTLRHAARAARHEFEFFGKSFQYGAEIDWQADPVTGRRWPFLYHADVPVHRGDIGCGDVKYVWELSRQQFLIDLAKAHFLTGAPEHLDAMRHLVRSWMAGNPYGMGVNWACALEPAFRVFSWLWAYYLTVPELDDDFHLEWVGGFLDHGHFLARHLEHHSSPYNHLVGEAAALYMLGACFPEFRAAAAWRSKGRSVLENRLEEQFYADGGSVEQSTFYHHATVGFYLLAALTARAAGEPLSDRIWRAIERGIEFSMRLTQPDGRTPELGGADDGKPIRMEHLPFWDFRPYQAVGAVLFGRPDFKAIAGRFFEDAVWLLGPAGRTRFDRLDAVPPPQTSAALEASGYYVLRSDWSRDADYVCVDCGEQAAGIRRDSVPNAMHGHADCLSLVVWLGGRRLLVDSGLYSYNCGGVWEAHFRETAAHNTVRVDGRDQALHLGKMAWSHAYRAHREGWMSDGRQSWILGSHDGYARSAAGVTHRRAVWLRPGTYVLVLDELTGSGLHDLEVNFQFAPGELDVAERYALFDGVVEAVWTGSAGWLTETRCGGPGPGDGWIATSLGVLQAAPRMTLTTRTGAARTLLLTAFALRQGAARRLTLAQDGSAAASPSLVVAGSGWTDWVATAGQSDGVLETDALLAVCRTQDGAPPQFDRIGGTYVRYDAEAAARLDGPAAIVGGLSR